MALYFREITGINPLTVDQTAMGPRSAPEFEHPAYRAAEAAGLTSDRAVILLTEANEPMASFGDEVFTDLQIVRPRIEETPVTALGYGTVRPWAAPEECGPCLVEVHPVNEGQDAVPIDRRTVGSLDPISVYGPMDTLLVVTAVDGRTGRLLNRRIVTAH